MKLLCIDTTTEYIVMALCDGDKTDYYVSEKGCKKHNSIILGLIDMFLAKNNINISDVDVFGVAVGPGSFTGIRIGVATVNAFALAKAKKIVEVTTLELPVKEDKVMTLLDCKHDNFYCGIFDGEETKYLALNKSELSKYPYEKIFIERNYVEELLQKCKEKVEKKLFVSQAKPFYVKKSSAELETGIECS